MFQFNLFGFRITVQPVFWIMMGLIGLSFAGHGDDMAARLAIWISIAFLSILWHELGHSFAFRRFGIESEIVLHGFGGYAMPLSQRRLTRGQDILVSAAGPAFQLLIGIPLFLLNRHGMLYEFVQGRPLAWPVLEALIFINIYWPIMNLLPVLPLDGGRILNGIMGPRRLNVTLWVSLFCSLGIAIWAMQVHMGFMAVMFGMMAWNNWCRITGRPEIPMS